MWLNTHGPRIRDLATHQSPGAVLCSDTRLSANGKPIRAFWSKSEPLGPNIVVCFTSSNAPATVLALQSVNKEWRLKRVATALKGAHEQFGGFAEVLAVVSRKSQAPSVLELMPPDYKPKPRQGIIGIGHRGVLDWIKRNSSDDVPQEKRWTPPAEVAESLARTIGHPVAFQPPTFTIEQAAVHIAAPLAEGIRLAGDATVSVPLQAIVVSDGIARPMSITSTTDMETFEDVTIDRDKVRLVRPRPGVIGPFRGRSTAVQLFS